MQASVGVEISVLRVVGKQIYRPNTQAHTPVEYYRRKFKIPFLDDVVQQLKERFW